MPATKKLTTAPKKSNHLKISPSFWKGLALGIVVALVGLVVYFKFLASKIPPKNGCVPVYVSGFGAFMDCR